MRSLSNSALMRFRWLGVVLVLASVAAAGATPARAQGPQSAAFSPYRSQIPAWVTGFWDGTWVTPTFRNFTDNNEITLTFTQVTSRGIKAKIVFSEGEKHPGGTYNVNVKVSGDSITASGGGLTFTGTHSSGQGGDGIGGKYQRPSESGEYVLSRETKTDTEIQGNLLILDKPGSPTQKQLGPNDQFLAYGSQKTAVADQLTLICKATGSAQPKKYTWSATGEGAGDYPPPPARDATDPRAPLWPLGDQHVQDKPADLQVKCQVDWSDGTQTEATQHVTLGIRTADVLVIGWINPAGVPLSATSVGADVLGTFPISGKFKSLGQQLSAATYLGTLTVPATPLVRPNGTGLLNAQEAEYILNWQFRYAANKMPPSSFANDSQIDAFKAKEGGYKLFNRAQIKYEVHGGQMTVDQVLHQEVEIGTTLDPLTGKVPVPGLSGPNNGKVEEQSDSWSLINDGTPDDKPVATFNKLASPQNIRWNHIGSRITFSPAQKSAAKIDAQLYPTYFVYVSNDSGDGLKLQSQHPQAARPFDNFTNPSYPDQSSDLGLLFRRTFFTD